MDIGNKILMLRKQQNITQEKLAAEMGVSIAAVSKWENGVSHS
jgi:transcriptional regulator with XRE-family HTH domain